MSFQPANPVTTWATALVTVWGVRGRMAVVLEILVERQSAELASTTEAAEFADIYRRTYAPLVQHCRTRLRAGDDAEDIAQAALVKAWSSWDRFEPGRPFWPWVVTIARRMAIDTYRRSARQDMLGAALRDEDYDVLAPEDVVAQKADAALALAALRRLRPQEQRLIGLRDLEGWSYDQLAEFEGEPVDLVRRQTHRARVALRASYLRVSQRMAGLAGVGWISRTRRRFLSWGSRVPTSTMTAATAYDSGVQALSGLAVLALALTAVSPAVVDRPAPRASDAGQLAVSAPAVTGDVTAAAAATAPPPSARPATLQALGLDKTAVPEDAAFDSFTPADDGRTVFAAGSGNGTCGAARCQALFVSRDAGATWSRLPADGYTGGTVMIPPAYPADSRIFVGSPFGLQLSTDGGETFLNISTVGGPMAMSPDFSDGDPRILIGGAPGWVYDDRDKSVQPLTSAALPPSLSRTFAFSPTFRADRRMLVGGTTSPLGGADVSTVALCDGAGCTSIANLDALSGAPELLVSDNYASDGLVFAWRPNGLYRSADGGRSFSRVPLPADAMVSGIVSAGPRGFLLTMVPRFQSSVEGGLFSSPDGLAWRRVSGLPAGISAARWSSDRLLVGPSWTSGGGLRCSTDGGSTWRTRCA